MNPGALSPGARILDPAGWRKLGGTCIRSQTKQARCTRLMYPLVPNETHANRLVDQGNKQHRISGLNRRWRAFDFATRASPQAGNRDALLLTAGSMLSGVNPSCSCSRCFGLGRVNLYAIGLTRNPHSIQIVCISIFLKADSRVAMRVGRLRRGAVNED